MIIMFHEVPLSQEISLLMVASGFLYALFYLKMSRLMRWKGFSFDLSSVSYISMNTLWELRIGSIVWIIRAYYLYIIGSVDLEPFDL